MYAIVDLETTGGNAEYNRITEIAILIHDGEKICDTYHSLINPGQQIPTFITQLTGISNEMVSSAPFFEDVAAEIHTMLRDQIFVAHNAGFDFAFLKKSFERNAYEFKLKKLCTVRLSKKIFPHLPKYSLGKLAESLGIKIENRHRALGDASATAEIFSLILKNDPGDAITNYLKRNSKEQILPPHLDKKLLQNLPTSAGVYYFHDEKGKIIYVGKAKNIKSRVINHFSFADQNGKENALRDHIFDISFEETGNELIALLLESEEIKRKNPTFNSAQKLWDRNYCIFKYEDQNGYIHLAIERFNRKKEMLRIFPNFLDARNYLNEKVFDFKLCPKLCHLQEVKKACYHVEVALCNGACIGNEIAEEYNLRVAEAMESMQDDLSTYFIFGKGRNLHEKSVIYVEHGHYLGFGYFSDETNTNHIDLIKDVIRWRPDTPDVQRILSLYLQKNAPDKFIISHQTR